MRIKKKLPTKVNIETSQQEMAATNTPEKHVKMLDRKWLNLSSTTYCMMLMWSFIPLMILPACRICVKSSNTQPLVFQQETWQQLNAIYKEQPHRGYQWWHRGLISNTHNDMNPAWDNVLIFIETSPTNADMNLCTRIITTRAMEEEDAWGSPKVRDEVRISSKTPLSSSSSSSSRFSSAWLQSLIEPDSLPLHLV